MATERRALDTEDGATVALRLPKAREAFDQAAGYWLGVSDEESCARGTRATTSLTPTATPR